MSSTYIEGLRRTKVELRQSIKADKLAWLKQLAEQATDMPVRYVVRRLKPLLGASKRRVRTGAGLPAVQLKDGTLAMHSTQANDRWIEYFAEAEGGTLLAQAWHERQWASSQDFPDIPAGESVLRGTSTGKAPGALSKALYQLLLLLLKVVFRLQEPLSWKGDILFQRAKARLSRSPATALLLWPTIWGRLFTFRRLPRHPVTAASHIARLFITLHARVPCYLLFLDLKEAFYRVARPLLVDFQLTEERTAQVFAALGISPRHARSSLKL